MKNTLILLVLFLTFTAYSGELLTCKVVKVIDGDTIDVNLTNGTARIRLYGIDAPEKDQEYGKQSTRQLSRLIDNEIVKIYVMDKDRYGRLVGKIFFEGEYINHTMVKEGAAWWYKQYASKDIDLQLAEEWARHEEEGLWNNDNPTAPWDYRHGTTTQSRAPPEKHEQIEKPVQEERIYWLNTKSYVRHNSSCRWYKNTKRGRMCTKNEGRACGICGG